MSRARVSALGLSPDPHHNRAILLRFFILHVFIGKANIRGGEFRVNFEDFEVIDEDEAFMSDPQLHYNGKIREYAAEKDLAVVDLFDLYQRIHQGGYRTDDGILVDGTAYGNFFSSDGIYPTPFGQAVIANEVIKAINKHYGAIIPLIDITGFVRTTGFEN